MKKFFINMLILIGVFSATLAFAIGLVKLTEINIAAACVVGFLVFIAIPAAIITWGAHDS